MEMTREFNIAYPQIINTPKYVNPLIPCENKKGLRAEKSQSV